MDFTFDDPCYDAAKELKAKCDALGVDLLHLTPVENVEAIRAEGLKSKSGMIFFVDTPLVLATVALNQVFVREFHVFGVKRGKSWRVEPDRIPECTWRHQWIVKAKTIGVIKLVDLGAFRVVTPKHLTMTVPMQGTDELYTFLPPDVLNAMEPLTGDQVAGIMAEHPSASAR